MSLSSGIVLNKLKIAVVIPLFKKDDTMSKDNYKANLILCVTCLVAKNEHWYW